MDGWVRVAMAIVPSMDRQAVKSEIVPFAVARAHAHGAGPQGQLVCCALLGAAAAKLTREDIQTGFLDKAVTLCQVLWGWQFLPGHDH